MISLIVTTRYVGDVLVPMLQSVSLQYDELILVDDKIGETVENLAQAINKGLQKARGDYLIVSNDDVVLVEGNLSELCKEGQVLSPRILNGGSGKAFHAHMWGMPREVYEKAVGVKEEDSDFNKPGYYEGYYRFYYDDSDYWMKLLRAGYPPSITDSVKIRHDHPATTIGTYGPNEGTEHNNKNVFIGRWGREALSIVL